MRRLLTPWFVLRNHESTKPARARRISNVWTVPSRSVFQPKPQCVPSLDPVVSHGQRAPLCRSHANGGNLRRVGESPRLPEGGVGFTHPTIRPTVRRQAESYCLREPAIPHRRQQVQGGAKLRLTWVASPFAPPADSRARNGPPCIWQNRLSSAVFGHIF